MSTLFVPLRNVKKHQKVDPACYDPEKDKGKGRRLKVKGRQLKESRFACRERFKTESEREFYVADIGQFALEFTHSFESKEAGLFGTASQFQGFFAACETNHIKDVRKECTRMK